MSIIETKEYRLAFQEYIRRGTPIRLGLKEDRPTDSYVWRTEQDENVRLSHRRLEGRPINWSDELPTGHPGHDYNCRCEAVPYVEGETEFAYHDFGETLSGDHDQSWSSLDIWQNSRRSGEDLTLREIGHLGDVVDQYSYLDGDEGALARLSEQIISQARELGEGSFSDTFSRSYDFSDVAYAHGSSTVTGQYTAHVTRDGDYLRIEAGLDFQFTDNFTDPYDIREWINGTSDPDEISDTWRRLSDIGSHSFRITDEWSTIFRAGVNVDPFDSLYGN